MVYGYARVSTRGQAVNGNSLEDQRAMLRENGAEEIVEEQFTGIRMERPELDKLIARLRDGDTLVVTKLDRLARNVEDGIHVIRELMGRGVRVNVLNVGMLEETPLGKFFLATLLAVAELERSTIIERMQAGKAVARTKAGFREGRPPIPEEKKRHAVELVRGGRTYREAARLVGISVSTVVRAARKVRSENKPCVVFPGAPRLAEPNA